MKCENCQSIAVSLECVKSNWICKICVPRFKDIEPRKQLPYNKVMLNFKHYHNHNGNVSKARIDMIKSRRMHPDGNGEVVITRNGKITSRNAEDY